MRIKFFSFLFFILLQDVILAQPTRTEYRRRIRIIERNIQRYFIDSATGHYKEFYPTDTSNKQKYSYLWPLCGLIHAAAEKGVFHGYGYMDTVLHRMQAYYDEAPPAPGYNAYLVKEKKEERFYDDNQWIGIACLRAWQQTKEQRWLTQLQLTYRFMMTGFDTTAGGGLYWKEGDSSTKNTCSNGPGVLVALGMYEATGHKAYLKTALLLYEWTKAKLRSPDGVYYDHIQLPSGKIDQRTYTYNTGTMLESSVRLYAATKQKKFLPEAQRLAAASLRHFYKNNSFPEHYWFNAVLLRGYVALYKVDRNQKYLNAMRQYGETLWQKERDSRNLLGNQPWKELIHQAAAMEIYATLAQWR
jgi:hypothetical protein